MNNLENQSFSVDFGTFFTLVLATLPRIEADSHAAAVKSTRILAHLKGEDEDEAVKKMKEDVSDLAKGFLNATLKSIKEVNDMKVNNSL